MNKVFLVVKGQYSDYTVRGVFADKVLADEYAAQISDRWDNGRVSEYEIMTTTDLRHPIGFRGYCVVMDRDGNAVEVSIDDVPDDAADSYAGFACTNTEKIDGKYITMYTGEYTFEILTDKGSDGAVKIANERRIQMIVNNKWPVPGEIENVTGEN